MLRLFSILLTIWPAAAQVPEIYRSVERVTWIVDDVDRVTQGWEKLGLLQIDLRSEIELPVTFRGETTNAKVRIASGSLGDVRVDWIQPLGGRNPFSEYQKKHVSGVFSLVYRVPTLDAIQSGNRAIARAGRECLAEGRRRDGRGNGSLLLPGYGAGGQVRAGAGSYAGRNVEDRSEEPEDCHGCPADVE
jgi:hypothetical protein